MKKKCTISTKVFWLAVTITVISTAVHGFIAYHEQHKEFINGVHEKLSTAAWALPSMLPVDAIHDKIKGPDSISPEEHLKYLTTLSKYTKKIKIAYLYTYIKFDDAFRVATTNATPTELKNGEETAFFTKYQKVPKEMQDAWKTQTIQYGEYGDEWGHFLSIFVPMQTKSGTPYIIGADVSLDFVSGKLAQALLFHTGIGLCFIFIILLLCWSVVHKYISPIGKLAAFTKELASTDFQLSEEKREELTFIKEQYTDEVGQLAEAFLEMQGKLTEYIHNLQETTAAKERIESELRIANSIQMSFLNKQFPPFPERHEFDLYAILVPAREVGGDLYDFCLLDEDHLLFYIGDVAGKGVPAALFMAVTMTLMHDTAKTDYTSVADPADILKKVNISLCRKNESLLFVTLTCFILNLKTGMLTYSNAGHNPPVVLRNDGSTEWMELPKGLVLGIMPEATFSSKTFQLHPGDKIVLETDGVTEAMSPEETLYSSERFIETISVQHGRTAEEISKAIMRSVTEHANGAPPSDDLTIMSLEYRGGLL
ncbi:MAG: PP2C family protein-serine/threonine phosphatase [Candidatus Electrothrix scaldis]|nr:MAG: PP2C family protein-serine/threonine phosphatase [Candidatus Electrothrix sp. GW3-3]